MNRNYENRKRRKSEAQNFNKYGIVVGETYGNYKVLEKIKVPHKVSRGNGVYVNCMATKWRTLYIPTGEIKITTTGYLSEFKSKSLQDLELKKLVENNQHQKAFRNYLYRTYKSNAIKRKHSFDLTQEQFENIIFHDCYYCGQKPSPASNDLIVSRGNKNEPTIYYNGIDRVNPNLGYSMDNCVPCCSICNYMKHTFQKNDFLNKIKEIYNHLNLSSTTIEHVIETKDDSQQSTLQANGNGSASLLSNQDEDIV